MGNSAATPAVSHVPVVGLAGTAAAFGLAAAGVAVDLIAAGSASGSSTTNRAT